MDQPPSQQSISDAWKQFSHRTKTTLKAAARGIAIEARDHDVISEALIPNELVRYHLCATLVVVGCAYPERLAAAGEALSERLIDENQYVRGRAVEALGLLARSNPDGTPVSADDLTEVDVGEDESFVADRVRFARDALVGSEVDEPVPEGIGTLDAIRGTTDDIVEAITSPDGDRECPHCGLALPENGSPMCPRCGAPY